MIQGTQMLISLHSPIVGYLVMNPDPNGSFQCAIPMRQIFGFVDDYSKVTYGMRDTLQLICNDDNDALFRAAAVGAGKVKLSKRARSVPIVQPDDVRKVNLYKSIASNNDIPLCGNVKRSLYLKQYLLYGDYVLVLHSIQFIDLIIVIREIVWKRTIGYSSSLLFAVSSRAETSEPAQISKMS